MLKQNQSDLNCRDYVIFLFLFYGFLTFQVWLLNAKSIFVDKPCGTI